jgi:hypothetical protein
VGGLLMLSPDPFRLFSPLLLFTGTGPYPWLPNPFAISARDRLLEIRKPKDVWFTVRSNRIY